MGGGGNSPGIRWFEIPDGAAGAEPEAWRRDALWRALPLEAHFDLHQSGTIGSLGQQACMFDQLVRRDPRDSGKTIIPDLASGWEISKDGSSYTFHLRKGALFHDGAELTSADIKATYDRISKPPSGISIPRSILFKAVSEIAAPDKARIAVQVVLAASGQLHADVGVRQWLERDLPSEDARR